MFSTRFECIFSYFDMKQHRKTDYQFSYDAMLDPKGNTAVYLLYAYARICSILQKSGKDVTQLGHDVKVGPNFIRFFLFRI